MKPSSPMEPKRLFNDEDDEEEDEEDEEEYDEEEEEDEERQEKYYFMTPPDSRCVSPAFDPEEWRANVEDSDYLTPVNPKRRLDFNLEEEVESKKPCM
jgi:hypothetical protein